MAEIIRLKKGLDIPLIGAADNTKVSKDSISEKFAIVPDDFPGHKWKLSVATGDKVDKGTPLLYDKGTGLIKLTSPVDGEVTEIRRGDRRKILVVVVTKTSECRESEVFQIPASEGDIRNMLLESGLWAMMRQRPFDIVPDPESRPRDIFITAFDSAPLAPAIIDTTKYQYLEKGIESLSRLTDGNVYLGVRFGSGISSRTAKVIEFQGLHPAGNTGVQIANVKPVNKGETVWTLDARTVARMGLLLSEGILDTTTDVAITGELAKNPHIVSTHIGAQLDTLLRGSISTEDLKPRIISGNVLTGIKCDLHTGFLRYPYRQITIIPEGDNADEFMGWASMNPKRYSVKRSFPAFLRGLTKPFSFDARLKGGHRAMIVSGEYDKVFPFDIYPEYLLRAIQTNDIDKMEKLGIYEVAPEDFALPEFIDTSKQPLQQIVRNGLDFLHNELG